MPRPAHLQVRDHRRADRPGQIAVQVVVPAIVVAVVGHRDVLAAGVGAIFVTAVVAVAREEPHLAEVVVDADQVRIVDVRARVRAGDEVVALRVGRAFGRGMYCA